MLDVTSLAGCQSAMTVRNFGTLLKFHNDPSIRLPQATTGLTRSLIWLSCEDSLVLKCPLMVSIDFHFGVTIVSSELKGSGGLRSNSAPSFRVQFRARIRRGAAVNNSPILRANAAQVGT